MGPLTGPLKALYPPSLEILLAPPHLLACRSAPGQHCCSGKFVIAEITAWRIFYVAACENAVCLIHNAFCWQHHVCRRTGSCTPKHAMLVHASNGFTTASSLHLHLVANIMLIKFALHSCWASHSDAQLDLFCPVISNRDLTPASCLAIFHTKQSGACP